MKKENHFFYIFSILLPCVLLFLPSALSAQAIQTPELIWQQVLGGSILGTASVKDGTITAVCDGGMVKSFNNKGQYRWEFKTGGKLLPFLTRSAMDTYYVCRTNGNFFAINSEGKLLWKINLKKQIVANTICGFDERVFIFLEKCVLCFSANGSRLWQLDFDSDFALPPFEDNSGGIAVVLTDGSLIRINAFGAVSGVPLSGIPAAVVPLEKTKLSSFSFLVFFKDNSVQIFNDFYPFGMDCGQLKAAPVITSEYDNNIAVILSTGEISLLNIEKGVLWTNETSKKIYSQNNQHIVVNNNRIYHLSKNGAIEYNLEGKLIWELYFGINNSIPIIGEDGILYTSGKDWILSAYKTSDFYIPKNKSTKNNVYGIISKNRQNNDNSNDSGMFDNNYYLKSIESDIRNGTIGEYEIFYTQILLDIADENNVSLTYTNERYRNKIEALRLLGLIGSPETIQKLCEIFRREKDNVIKAFIADTIGAIAVDINGHALTAFSSVIYETRQPDNERLLNSISKAIGRICLFMGVPTSNRAVPMLITIKSSSRSLIVKRSAQKELDTLFRNSLNY